MFNKHVITVVRDELGALTKQHAPSWQPVAEDLPALLYFPADAARLQSTVMDGVLRAPHSRFAGEAALDAYALPLVGHFLEERLAKAPDRTRREFAGEVIRNLNPVGTRFDRYIARFFECPALLAERDDEHHGYAVGVRTGAMDMAPAGTCTKRAYVVHKAIYSVKEQRRLLGAIYRLYEQYYCQALDRFGEHNKDDILPFCWDRFRACVSEPLLQFRDPSLAALKEWIAIAPYQPPTGFVVTENILTPWLALGDNREKTGINSLPLESIVLSRFLPGAIAKQSTRDFLRTNGSFQVSVSQTPERQGEI
jgi:hypothetical protein